jgi:hypothetical protein
MFLLALSQRWAKIEFHAVYAPEDDEQSEKCVDGLVEYGILEIMVIQCDEGAENEQENTQGYLVVRWAGIG